MDDLKETKCPYWTHCICSKENDFHRFDEWLSCIQTTDFIEKPFRISTITISFQLTHTAIELNQVKHFDEKLMQHFAIASEMVSFKQGCKKSRETCTNNNMYNCLILKGIFEGSRVSTMLFRNGAINTTGLQSMQHIMNYIKQLMQCLKYCCDKSSPHEVFKRYKVKEFRNVSYLRIQLQKKDRTEIEYAPSEGIHRVRVEYNLLDKAILLELKNEQGQKTFYKDCIREYEVDEMCEVYTKIVPFKHIVPTEIKISMINSNFKLSRALNLSKVQELFRKPHYNTVVLSCELEDSNNSKVSLKYKPYYRPMDKIQTRKKTIKVVGEISVMIYGTGSIMATGAIHTRDLLEVYDFIRIEIEKNQELVCKKN
jgi:TATA-box binding protein (TBP) (component of TFIID and TFIIIB)